MADRRMKRFIAAKHLPALGRVFPLLFAPAFLLPHTYGE
jgi:hypothetical protein